MPRPVPPLVARLGAVQGDVALVGGKAASLDRLARLGFRIPPGFCLTTAAFEAQLAAVPGVAAELDDLADEAVRVRLTAAFETTPLEAGVARELDAALAQLVAELERLGGPARFAVRSSGIGEDSSAASFAGLHETELDVPPEGVAAAVRRCWASLWSAPAVAYRRRGGLALDGGGMAVVVQALVPASAAAVVFTRHPVTGRTDQIVITAVRGLGDAMVSGTVTPDTWIVDRESLTWMDYTPGDGFPGAPGPAIEDDELRDLAALALDVERGFGSAVDIEAAVVAGTWFLLQARPITTNPGAEGAGHDGATGVVGTPATGGRADFPVAWDDPTDSSLTWDWDDMHMPFALVPLAEDYALTLGAGMNLRYTVLGDFPQRLRCRVWNGYAYFAYDPGAPETERPAIRERWMAALRGRVEVVDAWWRDEAIPEIRRLEASIRVTPVDDLSPEALATAWNDAWAATQRLWDLHFIAIEGPYIVMEDLADCYEAIVPEAAPGEAVGLVAGSRNELFEVELELERLVEIARGLPEVVAALASGTVAIDGARHAVEATDLAGLDGGGAFLEHLAAFLDTHGHLGQAFDDLLEASWFDEPSIVLSQVGLRLTHPPDDAETRRTRLRAGADALAEKARARLVGQPEEAEKFERLLTYGRAIGPMTEDHNYWLDRLAQARIRTFALRVGRRLVAAGCFDAPKEILFLFRDEVRATIDRPTDLRPLVAARRLEHDRRRRLVPPRTLGADPGERTGDRFDGNRIASDDPRLLRGTGASGGVVRGPARVTLTSADFGRIRPGDIIVCPSSNPSWVPVFTVAGGLVTNTGGVTSHAAVVAREFGLPAVVGTGDATVRIGDGALVEIDGTLGTVRLL